MDMSDKVKSSYSHDCNLGITDYVFIKFLECYRPVSHTLNLKHDKLYIIN